MTRRRIVRLPLMAVCGLLLVLRSVSAQQASGIAGAVRDASGAVLPGVTVEASSPALIEKSRTVVTDDEGRYNIVNLGPGTYVVTFTLTGFSTVKREGVVLTAGFTAAVNVGMQVGAVEETITVSGATPLVDISNVRRQAVVSKDLLDVLPTGSKTQTALMTLIPGMTVGGSGGVVGEIGGQRSDFGSYHGKSGTKAQFDGMGIQNMVGAGSAGYIVNSYAVEELTVQTSGISAESTADGAVANAIPKEGSNVFAGSVEGLYTNNNLQVSNMTDELRRRGLPDVNKILRIYDAGFTLGGPIKRDKLWFFVAVREWGNANQDAGTFWNKTQGSPFYTPDLSRPGDRYQWYESKATRVTWQATPKNKINIFADPQDVCICRSATALGNDPVTALAYHQRPQGLYQVSWSSPATNRLLFESAVSFMYSDWPNVVAPGVGPNDISTLEQSTNFRYGSRQTYLGPTNENRRFTQRFALSYVTGSHAFKAGFQNETGIRNADTSVNGNVNYTFNNRVPTTITQYATPYLEKERVKADMGVYLQDQWSIKRLTLNVGLRWDYYHGYVPAQELPATPNGWVPARSFAEVDCVPCWKDLDPRVGASYDVFGDGRTAVKVALGRYVNKAAVEIPTANNPINTSVNSVNRTWTDTNGNYIPDCDLGNRAANGECAAMSNQNFGGLNVTTRYEDEVIHGWGNRPYNWDLSTEVQQQLTSQVSVSAGYYRNWYGNFVTTDNLSVEPGDYSPYCITAPTDARLPGGGGYQVCGAYDVSLAKFGQVNNLVTLASNYGKQRQVNDFVNVGVNTRFRSGARLGGGVDTGRTVIDNCFVVDSPQQLLNCHVVTPFKGQTQIKLNGSYPLPYDFVVSGVLLSLSGPAMTASYAAPNASIAPSLGRNLAACGTRPTCTSTSTLPLIVPGTQYEHRINRVDLRLTKLLRLTQRLRLQTNLDAYNVFNASSIATVNVTYGSQWQLPLSVLEGRLVQFSANLTF